MFWNITRTLVADRIKQEDCQFRNARDSVSLTWPLPGLEPVVQAPTVESASHVSFYLIGPSFNQAG